VMEVLVTDLARLEDRSRTSFWQTSAWRLTMSSACALRRPTRLARFRWSQASSCTSAHEMSSNMRRMPRSQARNRAQRISDGNQIG
jgi:hypothetical protein